MRACLAVDTLAPSQPCNWMFLYGYHAEQPPVYHPDPIHPEDTACQLVLNSSSSYLSNPTPYMIQTRWDHSSWKNGQRSSAQVDLAEHFVMLVPDSVHRCIVCVHALRQSFDNLRAYQAGNWSLQASDYQQLLAKYCWSMKNMLLPDTSDCLSLRWFLAST